MTRRSMLALTPVCDRCTPALPACLCVCLLSVQDLSYLLRDNYAATMRAWLSSAVWLQDQQLQKLDEYCSPSQPADPDTRDMILAYKDNQEYSDITGRKLGPMMWDISYGVSGGPGLQRQLELEAHVCGLASQLQMRSQG